MTQIRPNTPELTKEDEVAAPLQLPHQHTSSTSLKVLLGLWLLLREHSDAEVSIQVRLEGGRDDQVFSGWQSEARADLTQVDEGLWPCRLSVGQEEILIQMHLPLPLELKGEAADEQMNCSVKERNDQSSCFQL